MSEAINGLENIYFGTSLCDECMGDCSKCSLMVSENEDESDQME
jgi:hypothetical protein